ncbi:MAG: nucleoside-diphosphate kinase [Methanophagales archaeon ANME-1-THS]|nr:MAG: nucleoside-diphosphate kinase [Methanophagales archaeon ANME-1-THS]
MSKATKKHQYTLVILKPDALVKSLTGNILTRLSEARLRIIGAKVVRVSRELAEKHYAHLKDEPFFDDLYNYFSGKAYGRKYERVLAFVYEGEDAISKVRKIAGATNPLEADPITIRGAYGRINKKGIMENVIHCSDSEESAKDEIHLWFDPDEIIEAIYPTKKVIRNKCEVLEWA